MFLFDMFKSGISKRVYNDHNNFLFWNNVYKTNLILYMCRMNHDGYPYVI